ncbi:telomerase inhibitor/ribosome biogenesis protein PXR1 [Aspergillus saccharolyticus JOP 1030-1]|uniref:Protein PXR1 n=1 Tax=Aspergillus saccharolyticus JOP 1030-1 TaxID=1450539 RepID=A0A318ZKH4_9EURO|nr:protein pxr1 [Aspergillus saccharolyticus JOP 1030-1]PYH47285.1 protein pxr1 [Aspergillus saccharolyticus JOP 1030-1]
MGLAAPRKKSKISHDPNNTNWSRSTTGFGHKILSSQGWTPGGFLGARNAAHADLFTTASASHIRVVVKDDTLGLGARPKRDALDEPTGLDAFRGLLGRLNGKSDAELGIEERKRENAKLARYAASRWQAVNFISGGYLVQEKTDVPASEQPTQTQSDTEKLNPNKGTLEAQIRPKTTEPLDFEALSIDRQGQHEGSPKQKSEIQASRKKKSKKRKKDEKQEEEDMEHKKKELRDTKDKSYSGSSEEVDTPKVNPMSSRERRPMGRHIFRSRHIAQKKRALLDEKSLNEVRS